MNSLHSRICMLAFWLLCACTDAQREHAREGSGAARWQRIELLYEGPASATSTVNTSFSVKPGDEQYSVSLVSPQGTLESVDVNGQGEMRPAWVLGGAGSKRLEIAGPFDSRKFQRVRLLCNPGDLETLRVHITRAGAKAIVTKGLRLGGERSATWIYFDIPELRGKRTQVDQIAVRFDGPGERVAVFEVQGIQVPTTALLPTGAAPASLVRCGEEARHARGLSSQGYLHGSFEVRRGSRLLLSAIEPDIVRTTKGKPLKLAWQISAEGGAKKTGQIALDAEPGDLKWREFSLPLPEFAGQSARLELRLQGRADGVAAIAEPYIVHAEPSVAAPTVLLVTSDTHRADHIGGASGAQVRTPFLDSLAARGVFFEDCWTSANVTRPSHVALLTSTSPRDTGIVTNHHRLHEDALTLAEVYREAGYLTYAAVSASPLDDRFSGLGQGFDRMTAPDSAQRDAAATIAGLRSWLPAAEGVPLFVWLHLFDAHAPYVVPEPYQRIYYPADRDPYDPALPALQGAAQPNWDPAVRDPSWPLAQYKAQVSYLDDRLAELCALPRFSEAIVAITSDHGESLNQHGIYYSHAELYPDTLHVPLILAWPGAKGGERVATAVQQIDIGRTLLDLSRLEQAPFPGQNLLAPRDSTQTTPRFALSSQAYSASLQYGRWFLVLHLDSEPIENGKARPRHDVELYDLEQDPGCLQDLSREKRTEAARLRAELVSWLLAAQTKRFREWAGGERSEEIARMAELGYSEGSAEVGSSAWIDGACECAACEEWREE